MCFQDQVQQDRIGEDQTLRTVTVPLRLEWLDHRIWTIQVVVIDRDELTEELRLGGQTIGFIHHAGRIFVALTGTRLDWAEECGQCLLWDKAAALLATTFGHLPEPRRPDPRRAAPAHPTGDRHTAHTSTGRRSAVHEMSR